MINNWYKQAQAEQTLKRIAANKNLPLWLGWALVAILMGSSIENAVKKYNLSPKQRQQLEMSLKQKDLVMDLEREVRDARLKHHDIALNPTNVQNASNPYFYGNLPSAPSLVTPENKKPSAQEPEVKKFDLNQIVKGIISHEGLLPKQTPFRITNPIMRKWKHILGFPIEHPKKVPAGRKNFIFLKNPQDVFPAVKKLFVDYATHPGKYGLGANPTLRDAIEVFDQTNSEHKIQHLTRTIPELDVDVPLKKIL